MTVTHEESVATDMTEYTLSYIFPAAFALLPGAMDTPAARAMLIAIALQESKFQHRHQIGGPAKGYWQFEKGGGVKGVLTHPSSKRHIESVCLELRYVPSLALHDAIEHNDVLACCFARLLLWTLPGLLAGRDLPDLAWRQYLQAWRPGKPHRSTWNAHYARAWKLVYGS